MTVFIDPPSGWRYGFPKAYVNPENKPLSVWLLENGYPQDEIDNGGLHVRWIGDLEDIEKVCNKENNY